MRCLSKITIKNKIGLPIRVPCGQCINCRVNKTTMWTRRLMDEEKMHDFSSFLTLTYSDENLPLDAGLSKRDVQLFLKKMRKRGYNFRYYCCGEYGEQTFRPHYHLILFGVEHCGSNAEIIDKVWGLGNIYLGSVTSESCRYVAKYTTKLMTGDYASIYGEKQPPYATMSNRPAIGKNFALMHKQSIINNNFLIDNKGVKYGIPQYYTRVLEKNCTNPLVQFCIGLNREQEERAKIKEKNGYSDSEFDRLCSQRNTRDYERTQKRISNKRNLKKL